MSFIDPAQKSPYAIRRKGTGAVLQARSGFGPGLRG